MLREFWQRRYLNKSERSEDLFRYGSVRYGCSGQSRVRSHIFWCDGHRDGHGFEDKKEKGPVPNRQRPIKSTSNQREREPFKPLQIFYLFTLFQFLRIPICYPFYMHTSHQITILTHQFHLHL